MFRAPFLSDFAACLAIWLSAHFGREWRQRSAFIASLSPTEREKLLGFETVKGRLARAPGITALADHFKPLRARRPGSPEYGSLAFADDRRSHPQR